MVLVVWAPGARAVAMLHQGNRDGVERLCAVV